MTSDKDFKGIYRGPWHFWNRYNLNARERYHYRYYGMYGPWVDKSMYEPIQEGGVIDPFVSSHIGSQIGGCGCFSDWWSLLKWFIVLWVMKLLMKLLMK